MSRALARLREVTGDPLFVRAGRGLVPTPRASELRTQVGELVEGARAVLRPAEALDLKTLTRRFTLRTSEGFAETFGPRLLTFVADQAPGVRLQFLAKADKESTALRDGEVDIETGVIDPQTAPKLRAIAARTMESAFIAVGIVALLSLNTLRLHAENADEASLVVVGQALVAMYDWTFRLGPGVGVGVGNGLILGWMMWKTRLVPRAMSVLGLIGGPALLGAGIAILFGAIEIVSTSQVIASVPEFFWELSLGIWLLVKGFDPAALAALIEPRP